MKANELRRRFTSFFEARDHLSVPSASLIPHDPTLLFTVAGMVPFKPYFLGEETPPGPRVTSVQKCVRAGGKQNDLEEVGRTSRHLTFFEMLGNFSFGDYFKDRAIDLAWEFLTVELGLDPERMWVTVHLDDDEAERLWLARTGIPAERLQRLDEDNFWRMGDTGPCGPCSEVFWDKGPEYGPDGGPAHGGEERFVEIWNLVFMQFDQTDAGMTPLPRPSIDTGAGLERVLTVLQGVDSVWDLDELSTLVDEAARLCAAAGGSSERTDVSLRILADHSRSSAMLVADGVFPSNEGRGYVLRRIIRRAVRHAYLLGATEPVLADLARKVADIMGSDYPELLDRTAHVASVIEREELRFRSTLASGLSILDRAVEELADGAPLAGRTAFQLHDTYGFPLELTVEVLSERGLEVDRHGFDAAMAEQVDRARAARSASSERGGGGQNDLAAGIEATDFVGRDTDEVDARVVACADNIAVLDVTPFYAESGGQVGDTGWLVGADGKRVVVDTTSAPSGVVLHHLAPGGPALAVGTVVTARIDAERRARIKRNHTATHLLHWALREVLGDHVQQQGSLVGEGRLRFDFSHHHPMTVGELRAVEDLVNEQVLSNATVRHIVMSKEEAIAAGALAFFGDKYGDVVRVLEAGPRSLELCGGTHVSALGDIGLVYITGEASIGANIRRVEAVTGTGALEALRDIGDRLDAVAAAVGVPAVDLDDGIAKRLGELDQLKREVSRLRDQVSAGRAAGLAALAADGVVIARLDTDRRDDLKATAVAVRAQPGIAAVVLVGSPAGKGVALAAASAPGFGLSAAELLAPALSVVGGGGGKGAELAVAGGRDASRIDDALAAVRSLVATVESSARGSADVAAGGAPSER